MAKPVKPRKAKSGHPAGSTLAEAPFHTVQDSRTGKNCQKFFQYWKDVAGTSDEPGSNAHLVEVRWYLHWPIVDARLADPKAKTKVFELMNGPIWFDNPEDYLAEVPKRLGSGSWHVVMNEVGVHGELMEAYFSAIDLDRYPPKLDLRTLVRGVPENEDYIRWLRVNNIKVPWDSEGQEEEDEMANSEILSGIVGIVERQGDRAAEAVREAADAKVEILEEKLRAQSPPAPTVDAQTAAESVKLISDTAQKQTDATIKFADKMVDMYTRNAGSQYDPIALIKAMRELDKPDNSLTLLVDTIKDGNAKMVEMQNKNIDFMKEVLNRETKPPEGITGAGGLKGMLDQVNEIKQVAELFGYRRPSEEIEHAPKQQSRGIIDFVCENPQMACNVLISFLTLGANIVHNVFSRGQAPSPQEALQRASQVQFQNPPPQAPTWEKLIEAMAPAIKKYFYDPDGEGGYLLIRWVKCEGAPPEETIAGEEDYLKLCNRVGKPQFDQLIRQNSELWNAIGHVPARYEQFLDQFFGAGYEEWMKKQESQGVAA